MKDISNDEVVNENKKLQLSCPLFESQKAHWYFEKSKIKPSKRVSMKRNRTHSFLEIFPALPQDTGLFSCRVSDKTRYMTVRVLNTPKITISPMFTKTVKKEYTFLLTRNYFPSLTQCYVNGELYYTGLLIIK